GLKLLELSAVLIDGGRGDAGFPRLLAGDRRRRHADRGRPRRRRRKRRSGRRLHVVYPRARTERAVRGAADPAAADAEVIQLRAGRLDLYPRLVADGLSRDRIAWRDQGREALRERRATARERQGQRKIPLSRRGRSDRQQQRA